MSSATSELDMQDMLRRLERCEQRHKTIGGLLLATVVAGAFFSMHTPAISQTSGQMQAEIAALQNTLKYVTTTGTDMVISGANLHIVKGAGATTTKNGLGNLIVGYNEKRDDTPSTDVRTGSHNLIVGIGNSYKSFGGVIFGSWNSILDDLASVTGGFGNTASGQSASVTGGYLNMSSGLGSSIVGGTNNSVVNDPTDSYGSHGSYGAVLGGEYITGNTLYGTYPP